MSFEIFFIPEVLLLGRLKMNAQKGHGVPISPGAAVATQAQQEHQDSPCVREGDLSALPCKHCWISSHSSSMRMEKGDAWASRL